MEAAPAPSPPATAPPDIVTLSLSLQDRWFPTAMLSRTPWGGGEKVVTSFGTIWNVLRLAEVPINTPVERLPTELEQFEFTRENAEVLIRVICGASGQTLPGAVGPRLAALAVRIRMMLKEQPPTP
jgi:hypothetical protein